MKRTRYYHLVKLAYDPDSSACAATTMGEAIRLLGADPSIPLENCQVLSMRVRATDAGAARLMVGSNCWIGMMKLSHMLTTYPEVA